MQFAPEVTQVTDARGLSTRPSLVWTGTGYALTWVDSRHGALIGYLARFDERGALLSPEQPLAETIWAMSPSLAWNGDGFGLAWYEQPMGAPTDLRFLRLGADGSVMPPAVRFAAEDGWSYAQRLVAAGEGYGLAWSDEREGQLEVYFTVLARDGQPRWPPTRLSMNARRAIRPDVVHTGDGFGTVWADWPDGRDDIYFARLDGEGMLVGEPRALTRGESAATYPAIAWTGEEFLVVWSDHVDGRVVMQRVSPDGRRFEQDVRITGQGAQAGRVAIAWTGRAAVVSWVDQRDFIGSIRLTAVTPAGERLLPEQRLGRRERPAALPTMVWTGRDIGIAWVETFGLDEQIVFATVSLPCLRP